MADTYEILIQRITELTAQNTMLMKMADDFRHRLEDGELKDVKRDYKDRLFKFIFGNPEKKHWTLSLYNAISGTDYSDPEEIQFNTIGNAVYMRMKNDVSFLISFEMNLWEHQSSFNPNIPIRFLIYGGRLYEKYISATGYFQYSKKLHPIPRPVCVCFYNGTKEQPQQSVLRLSDAYEGEGGIEVKVTMLNINYGKNRQLMNACQPLKEYAWFINAIRTYQNRGMSLDPAVDASIDEMPDDYEMKPFLLMNRAEVKNMFLTEYNEEEIYAKLREEGREEGREVGREEGREEGRIEILSALVRDGIISPKEAAARANVSETVFKKIIPS